MIRGRPILHKDAYTDSIYPEVLAWFNEAIFEPLVALLDAHGVALDPRYQGLAFSGFGNPEKPKSGRYNAVPTGLVEALRSGRVQYADGVFSGRFSAAISKDLSDLGAHFNPTDKTFRISAARIPLDLRGVLADAANKAAAVNKAADNLLRAAEEHLATSTIGLQVTKRAEAIIADLGSQFMTSVVHLAPKDIGLSPTLDPFVTNKLTTELTKNLELGIRDFAAERIPELRARVQENLFKFGGRTDRLSKIIEAEFGVTKRKAQFLADQETGLLVSKYRAARYQSIGIDDYTWSTSHDNRVRHSHELLDGKRFKFTIGANVSEPGDPARYCNPGEDYRCRCVPIPFIDLKELAA